MELRNLKELAESLRNSFASNFDPSDRKLPQSFKDRVTKINTFNLTYNDYSVVFGGGTGSLDSYIPNQLFYIAAYYNEYTQQLFYYKSKIMKVISASGFSGNLTELFTNERKVTNPEESQFYALLKDQDIKEENKELLYKFVTDYDWWHGAKTIERNDFFNSAILSVMGMTASSNSTLAMICGFFANKPEVADLLNSSDNNSSNTLISDKALTSFILRCVKELSNIDGLNSLIPYITSPISEGKPIKIASSEDGFSLTGMFLETTEEDRIARNEKLPRWFPDEFTLDGHKVYLSTQWNGKGDYQLTKADFVKMINVCYPNKFSCNIDETPHTLRSSSPETGCISLQTIYFGSPGTGKSFKIKDKILDRIDDSFIFRTTFHPDTDYASFVGCYKPATEHNEAATSQSLLDYNSLVEKLKEYLEVKPVNITRACVLFGFDYHDSIVRIQENNAHTIPQLIEDAYKPNTTYDSVMRGGMATYESSMRISSNSPTITYKFTPQTFTNAYVKAWQNPTDNIYLVIEEINRGNCAQIFGDLFQLLDRNDDGVSEYPIIADADLTKYLQDTLGESHEGISDGKIKLPANLYILATMNTSDQSLFPMDSAFKRRWEWQYVPTSVTGDKKKILKVDSKNKTVLINKEQEQKVLKLGMYQYDWSLFLEKINQCITDATHSDDKQLGFWFVKTPKGSNEIKIETFVSKVIFYLWTDVFKDFGAKATNPFAFKNAEGGWVVCPFSSFFDPYTGEINLGSIHGFMYNLGIIPDLEPDAEAESNKSMQNPPDKDA